MQQTNFELLQKIPQNLLPLYLLAIQNISITPIPRSNYFPQKFNLENNPFYQFQSIPNFPHFNFAKHQETQTIDLPPPAIFAPNHLINRDFLSQQFFYSSVYNYLAEPKKVNMRDSPDISSEDIIQKKLKIEDSTSLSSQNCVKTELKQEEEERIPQAQPIPIRSPPRNKWKNIPGHIMFAIKRGCKRCKENPEGPQINSIKQKWESLPEELKSKFWTFIQKYNRSWKTWSSIIQFISQEADQETTQILIDLISELLSSKHKESFETWLSQTKISGETKESIKLGKKVFREEFIERIRQTQK